MATMAAGDVGIGRGNGIEVAALGDSERLSTAQPRRHEHLLRKQEHAKQLIQLRARQRQLARKRFFAVVNASEWDDPIEDDEDDEEDEGASPGASSSHGGSSPGSSNLAVSSQRETIIRPPRISKSFPPPHTSVDGDIRIATDFSDNFMTGDTTADAPFKPTYPSDTFATSIAPPFPPLTNSFSSPSSSDSEDNIPDKLRSRFSVSTIATATPTTSPINNRSSVRKSGLSFRLASLSGRASRALRRGTITGPAPPAMVDAEKAVSAAKGRSGKAGKDGRNSFFALAHTFSAREPRRQHPPTPSPIPVLPPLPSATSFTFSTLSGVSGPQERRSPSLHFIPDEIPSVAPSFPPFDRFARLDGDDDTIGYAYTHQYSSSIDDKQSLKQGTSSRSCPKFSQHHPRRSQDSEASKLSRPSQEPTPALLPRSLSGRGSLSGGESCLTTPDLSHSLPLAPPVAHLANNRSAAQIKFRAGPSMQHSGSMVKSSPSPRMGILKASGRAPTGSAKSEKLPLPDASLEVSSMVEGAYTPVSGPSSALGLDLGLDNDAYVDSEQQAKMVEKKLSVQSFNSLGTDYRIRPSDLGLRDDSGSEYEDETYEAAPSTRPHSVVSTRRRWRRTHNNESLAFRPSLLVSLSSPVSPKRQRSRRGRKSHTPSASVSHRLSSYYGGLSAPTPPLPSSARSSALTYGGQSVYSTISDADPGSTLLSPPVTPWLRMKKERASRASIQTFGSSVLTYGSRASYLLGAAPQCVESIVYLDDHVPPKPEDARLEAEDEKEDENELSPDRSDVPPRPDNPLPWAPRPSAISNGRRRANTYASHTSHDSTSSAGSGSRPLPPIPTGTSTSTSKATREETRPRPARRPRPLPNPPVGGAAKSVPEPLRSAGLLSPPTTASSSSSLSFPRKALNSAGLPTSAPWSSTTFKASLLTTPPSTGSSFSKSTPSASSSPKPVQLPLSRAMSIATTRSSFGTNTLGGGTGALPVPDIEELVALLDEADRKARSRPTSRSMRVSSDAGRETERRHEVLRDVRAHLRGSRKVGVLGIPADEREARGRSSQSPAGSTKNSPAQKPAALPALVTTSAPSPAPSPPQRPSALSTSSLALAPAPVAPTVIPGDSLLAPTYMTLEEFRASMLHSPAMTDYDDGGSSVGGTLLGGTLINGFPLPPGLAHISLTPPAPLVPDSVKAESRTNSIAPQPLAFTKSRSTSLSSSVLLNKLEESSSEGSCSAPGEMDSENERVEKSSEAASVALPPPPYPTLPVNGAVTSSPPHIRKKRHHQRTPNGTIDVNAANSLGLREKTLLISASRQTFDRTDGSDATKAESDYDNSVIVLPPSPTIISNNPPEYQEATTLPAATTSIEVDDAPGSPFVAPLRLSKVMSMRGMPAMMNGLSAGPAGSNANERARSSSLSEASFPTRTSSHARSDSCSSAFSAKSLVIPSTFEAPKVAPLRLGRASRTGSMLKGVATPNEEQPTKAVVVEAPAQIVPAVVVNTRAPAVRLPPPPYSGSVPAAPPNDSSLFARQDDGQGVTDEIIEPSFATVMASMSSLSRDRETIWSSRDAFYANNTNVTLGDDTGYDDVGCSSMNTLASSINTEHQHTILGFGFGFPGEPLVQQVAERKKSVNSRNRSMRMSMGAKAATRAKKNLALSNPPDEQLLRSLPDPSTFPIPYPITGSNSTPPSSYGRQRTPGSAGSNVLTFARPTPLPKLKLVTDFSKPSVTPSNVPIPIQNSSRAPQPASAVSTMSNFNFSSALRPGHARKGSSAASIRSVSSSIAVGSGKRRMNRQTLTDPRSPMPSAQVAAATLVARVKQKREAIAKKKKAAKQAAPPPSAFQNAVKRGQKKGDFGEGAMASHGANGGYSTPSPTRATAPKGKARLGGSGFFGSTVRAYPDPVNRPAPRPQRPFVKIPTNPMFNNYNTFKGIPVSKHYFKNNAVLRA